LFINGVVPILCPKLHIKILQENNFNCTTHLWKKSNSKQTQIQLLDLHIPTYNVCTQHTYQNLPKSVTLQLARMCTAMSYAIVIILNLLGFRD